MIKKLIFLSFALFSLAGIALAQSDNSLAIQPAQIQLSAVPGQNIAKSFLVVNRSNFYVRFKIIVKDYKQSAEDGSLSFYQKEKNPASSWIVPQYVEIGLKPLESKNIGFVMSAPKDMPVGGHYGAILLEPIDLETNAISTNNFGALILLEINGKEKSSVSAQILSFGAGFFPKGRPVDFSLKMKNSRNTHFSADARIVLKNWAGKEIGAFNIGQITVYPETTRVFKWRWSDSPGIGIYNAVLLLSSNNPQGQSQKTENLWFFIFPWQAALAILILLIAIFLALRYGKNIYERTANLAQYAQKIKIRVDKTKI